MYYGLRSHIHTALVCIFMWVASRRAKETKPVSYGQEMAACTTMQHESPEHLSINCKVGA